MEQARFIQKETTRHGKTIYYFRRSKKEQRYRLPDEYGSRLFWAEYNRALKGQIPQPPHEMRNVRTYRRTVALHECIREGVFRAKTRAKAKGLEFGITVEWAIEQMKASDYRCPLTDIPFSVSESRASFARPHAPSLDRIDPKRGYTTDNVRVVVFVVNLMISDWGEDVFFQAASGYRRTRRKRLSIPAPTETTPHRSENANEINGA